MDYLIKLNLFIFLSFLLILNQSFFSQQKLKSSYEYYRGNKKHIPELYDRPCSYTSRNTGNCNHSEPDSRYISGYQPMIFGIPIFVTYERVGNKKFKLIKRKLF